MPKLTLVLLAIVLISISFHQMALFTLICIGLFPVAGFSSGIPAVGYLVGNSFVGSEQLTVTLALSAIFMIMVLRRLTAPRSEFAIGLSILSLYTNRLLWDRDIRDRKAWLSRKPVNGTNGCAKKKG